MVDADISLAAPQPMTNTAESSVSFASDGFAKQSQDAEVSDTQLVIDNSAMSLSEASTEELDIGNAVLGDSDTMETEDTGLKNSDDGDDNGGGGAVDTKDVVVNTISEVSTSTNSDNVAHTSIPEETSEAFITEVSPSAQESTLSIDPSSRGVETEPAPESAVDNDSSTPIIVEVEAPVTEQQAIQTTFDTPSHVNEEIAEVALVEEDDAQAELGIEKITSVDNESAEKEAESSKLMGVEDKTAESHAKEETAIDIKADETHVESAIPQVSIQIEEAEDTPAGEIAETINVGSHNADDSLIAVEVVTPTPGFIDNRQLEESDTDNTPTSEGYHEKATSAHAIPLEAVMASEGTCTPRVKPETEELVEEKASVKEEAVENDSPTTSSTVDEAFLVKEEETTDASAEAPTKAVAETRVNDGFISSESVEIITGEVSAINFAPAVVEEYTSVQGEASTKVEIVAEVVPDADISFVEEKLVVDDAASTSIPETQFVQEDSEVPVPVPVQENVGEVVTTQTESISQVAPVIIAEPQSVQDAPPGIVVAAEDQRTEEDLLHTAAIDLVQTSQTPAIEESNNMMEIGSSALATADLTPEPAAKAMVTHEIPVTEDRVITQEEVAETAASQGQAVDTNDLKNVPTETAEESAIEEVVSGAEAEATVDFEVHQVTEEQLGVVREVPVTREGKEDGTDGTDVKVAQEFTVEEPMEKEESVKDPVLEKPVVELPSVEEFVKEEAVVGEITTHKEAVSEPAKEELVTEVSAGEPVKEDLVPDQMPVKEELVAEGLVKEDSVAEKPVKEELMIEELAGEEFAMRDASTTEEAMIKESIKEEPAVGGQVEEEPATEGILAKEELVVEGLKDEPTAGVLLKSEIFVEEVAEKEKPIASELAEKEPIVRAPIQEEHALEAPAAEPVAEEIPGSVVQRLPAEEDRAVVGERPTIKNLVIEEVSGKDFAVEEPVQEETIAEESGKAQVITEAVGEESAKDQHVAEKKDELAAEVPAKEDPVVEDVPAEEGAKEPTKEASVVEEPINEDTVVNEPIKGELIMEAPKEESELVGSVAEEVASDESAIQKEVVEELFTGNTAAEELIPVIANIPREDVGHGIIVISKEPVAVESLVDQDVSVGQTTSASQLVKDVESLSGELEANVEESVLEDTTADIAIPILEEEKSAETSEESIVDMALDQPIIISASVVVTEEPVAQTVLEPPVQDTLNVNKADSDVLFTISPPEPDHGPAAVAVAEQSARELVVDNPSDQEAVESIGDTSVVLPPIISDDSAIEEVKIDDSPPEDSPTEKLAAANDESPTVALIESLSDESVLMAEISIADTTTETIMVPELNEEKKVEDMVPVVEEIKIADGVETLMPEKFILSIPDDSMQLEGPKSPWTPSFQVTTLGHGISLSTEERTTEERTSAESLRDVEDVKLTRPDIMVDASPSDAAIETAQPPTEIGEPESATLSWTPSYSVHSQGSSSPSYPSLELTTANTEDKNLQVLPTDHDNTFVTHDTARFAECPSISEAAEVQDREVSEAQDVRVIEDSSHEGQEIEAVVVSQVIGQQAVECEEPVQDEIVPYPEMPTDSHLGSEVTEKPFIAQVSSLMPAAEQDRPISPSWVPSFSVSQQGSLLPEQVSPPNTTPAEIVTTTTFGEPLNTESGRSQVGVISTLPIVELNGSQLEDTQEESVAEDGPPAARTSSYSATQQGCDVFEESQLETLVKDDPTIEREPRRSLSEEIEGSNGFSAAALIGASIFGNPTSMATLQKSTVSFKSAKESATDIPMANDATPSGSCQRSFFPSLENRLHASSLRPLDENNDTLDLSSSFSTDASLLSSRKRLESTTSSRLLPGGWFSSTSKIPDERTSPEVAQGIFTGTKQTPVEETLISPITVPNSPVRQQSSDKRKCLIM